jgi:hypothetical protein
MASEFKSKGMLIDGVAGSEAIDSSGETLSIEGADISELIEGRATLNWEHQGTESPGHSPSDHVGKIVFAKKIFSAADCDTDRQLRYWKDLDLPFIYIVGRLFDAAGHEGAKALAAQIRDYQAHGEPILARFSVEGSTIQPQGRTLKQTIIRRVAVTVRPCNRSCVSGLIYDPLAPEGYEKEPGSPSRETKDFLEEVLKRSETFHPNFRPLGGSVEIQCDPRLNEDQLPTVSKAYTAGGGMGGAPDSLTGGAALQREEIDGKVKAWTNRVKTALRDWDGKGKFRDVLKAHLPEASNDFIDHFSHMVDELKVRRSAILKKEREDARSRQVRKLEALTIELRKAGQDTYLPPEVEFQGRKIKPGSARMGGTHYAILSSDADHHIAVPSDKLGGHAPSDLVKLPRASMTMRVHSYPVDSMASHVVDAVHHGDPRFNRTPAQHDLVHGIDFRQPGIDSVLGVNADSSHWRKGGDGTNVYVKAAHDEELSDARREVLYHNLAKDFFGLGQYVPRVALIRHPRTGQEHAVIEHAEGEHPEGDSAMSMPAHQKQHLMALGDSGELDKLALMNMITGNSDRHAGNYLLNSQNGALKLIDHGNAFDSQSVTPPIIPHYIAAYQQLRHERDGQTMFEQQIHPEAAKWASALDPAKLQVLMQQHQVPEDYINESVRRAQAIKDSVALNPQVSRYGALQSPFFPTGTLFRPPEPKTKVP